MARIMMVVPFLSNDPRVAFTRNEYEGQGIDVAGVSRAPKFPMNFVDVEYTIEGIIDRAAVAEEAGYDAVIIGCFGDPGLEGARQKVRIPVIGPGQSAVAMANLLGHKFSVITIQKDFVVPTENLVRINGLYDKLASIRVYTCNITELDPKSIQELGCGLEPANERDAQITVDAAIRDTIAAIELDGASVVVFGCIGMSWMIDKARPALLEKGYKVPIVEPGLTAVHLAKAICDMKLSHTRVMYPFG